MRWHINDGVARHLCPSTRRRGYGDAGQTGMLQRLTLPDDFQVVDEFSRIGDDCGHCLGCVDDATAPKPYDDVRLMASSCFEPRLDVFCCGLTKYLKQADITALLFQSSRHSANAVDVGAANHQDTAAESAHDVWELRGRARTKDQSLYGRKFEQDLTPPARAPYSTSCSYAELASSAPPSHATLRSEPSACAQLERRRSGTFRRGESAARH